jgi:hypothetical protein
LRHGKSRKTDVVKRSANRTDRKTLTLGPWNAPKDAFCSISLRCTRTPGGISRSKRHRERSGGGSAYTAGQGEVWDISWLALPPFILTAAATGGRRCPCLPAAGDFFFGLSTPSRASVCGAIRAMVYCHRAVLPRPGFPFHHTEISLVRLLDVDGRPFRALFHSHPLVYSITAVWHALLTRAMKKRHCDPPVSSLAPLSLSLPAWAGAYMVKHISSLYGVAAWCALSIACNANGLVRWWRGRDNWRVCCLPAIAPAGAGGRRR